MVGEIDDDDDDFDELFDYKEVISLLLLDLFDSLSLLDSVGPLEVLLMILCQCPTRIDGGGCFW